MRDKPARFGCTAKGRPAASAVGPDLSELQDAPWSAHAPGWLPAAAVCFAFRRAVAVAFTAEGAVGIDVEQIDASSDVEKMSTGVLAKAEFAHLMKLSPAEWLPGFSSYWTRKEAVLKATGEGLSVPPASLLVTGPDECPRVLALNNRTLPPERITLLDLNPGPGYKAAIAMLDAHSKRVHEFNAGGILRSMDKPNGQIHLYGGD